MSYINVPKQITLSTLNTSTAQEVFNWITFNLLMQGCEGQSRVTDNFIEMKYHDHDGNKCAAGWLIGKYEYHEDMEGYDWKDLITLGYVPKNHKDLIISLQKIHDTVPVKNWKPRLIALAKKFHLETPYIGTHNNIIGNALDGKEDTQELFNKLGVLTTYESLDELITIRDEL